MQLPWLEVKSQACHGEGPGLARGTLQEVLFPRFSSEAADRPHCLSILNVKIPSKFEIPKSENLTKEHSRGEAFIQRHLASPLYEDATHVK